MAFNFITKTVPTLPGFVSTVANKWFHDQEQEADGQLQAEVQAEIQGQIVKISEMLREQEAAGEDSGKQFDLEVKYQLSRIQQLLHETKERKRSSVSHSHTSHTSSPPSPTDSDSNASSVFNSPQRTPKTPSPYTGKAPRSFVPHVPPPPDTPVSNSSHNSQRRQSGWSVMDEVRKDELRQLFSKVRHNRQRDVQAALDSGAVSASVRDEFGNTLLIMAAQNGNKRIAKMCLREGTDINAQNFRGQTALHYCFAFQYAELGEYLKSKGAHDDIVNEYGLTTQTHTSTQCCDGLEPH